MSCQTTFREMADSVKNALVGGGLEDIQVSGACVCVCLRVCVCVCVCACVGVLKRAIERKRGIEQGMSHLLE